MTPEDILLVQSSFKKVPAAAAQLFYARLFEIAPQLRPMFGSDMTVQAEKLMAMLVVAVNGLTNLEKIVPAVRELGARHADYGVTPEHYETVGTALIWTLDKGLGDDFTDDIKQAWINVYGLLSSTMIEAAQAKAA